MTAQKRLSQLEEARIKLGLNDIEEVKEHAIELYLQIVSRREKNYPPRLVSNVSGGTVTLVVS